MNRRIKLSSPSATHLFLNSIMHSRLRSWKMKQVPCLLRANGFLFLPRMHGIRFKLITSSHQRIKLPKSTCFLWTQPFYENKLKKKACSCQFYVEIKANDANGCYPLRLMEGIGSLKNNYLSLHVNIRIRHRNQSLEQYWRVDISLHQVFLNYSKLPLFSYNLTTAFLHIVSITDAFSLVVNISKRAMTTCFTCFSILSVIKFTSVNSVLFGLFTFQFLRGIMK